MKRKISAPKPDEAPAPQWDAYEAFARDALGHVSAGSSEDCAKLREQLNQSTWLELDYTGAGFFLNLDVPDDAPKLPRSGIIVDVHAEAAGADTLGLLLFVEDRVARTLEAFGYGAWPDDIARFRPRYVRWVPRTDGNGATGENVEERDLSSMWQE